MLAGSALACWRQDEFRTKCLLADTCALPEEDAGVDAGLSPARWAEVAALLFDLPAGVDAGFDVHFTSNLSANEDPGGRCRYSGGVLTQQGTVLCIPSGVQRAVEFLQDGGVQTLSLGVAPAWAGGVLLENGTVLGLPVTSPDLLALLPVTPPFVNRSIDLFPLSPGVDGGAQVTGGVRTVDGTVVMAAQAEALFFGTDGGVRRLPTAQAGEYSGAILTESGRSALLVPRTATRLLEAIVRAPGSNDRLLVRSTAALSGYGGGLLLENGDALLMPAAGSTPFARVPVDGGPPQELPLASPGAFFSAAWSTNGFAYSLETDGGVGLVAVISRRGDVSFAQLPAFARSPDAGFFPGSHFGLTAMPDGRLVSCGCRSASVLVLTPRYPRTVPVEVMSGPWLNKW